MSGEDLFDDVDRAYLKSILKDEEAIPTGIFTVVTYLDAEGVQRWKRHTSIDAPVSQATGALFIAMLAMIAECKTGIVWDGDDANG